MRLNIKPFKDIHQLPMNVSWIYINRNEWNCIILVFRIKNQRNLATMKMVNSAHDPAGETTPLLQQDWEDIGT